MTEKDKNQKNEGGQGAASGNAIVYDERKKLAELRSLILHRGETERERIMEEARSEADRWFETQSTHLDSMVKSIRADAEKRSREIAARHAIDAQAARDRDRLRLQNELVLQALGEFQKALTAFSERPDYAEILAGVTVEACAGVPAGETVNLRLRAEDAAYGPIVTEAVNALLPNVTVLFDPTPAAILGGVFLSSEEGKWRVAADWKSKVEEMADTVAKAVLAEL